ncbi:hypothetical protein EYF80_054072 [Liparis tanakae]|uniref:Uncharacterized protein n=1 Tax=Liparis tanakae TaxID=230148 RepID=A0A4Z2F3R4_9TELE|nr:hypothetical protein EYF80_054072 [Liparis tanakae]
MPSSFGLVDLCNVDVVLGCDGESSLEEEEEEEESLLTGSSQTPLESMKTLHHTLCRGEHKGERRGQLDILLVVLKLHRAPHSTPGCSGAASCCVIRCSENPVASAAELHVLSNAVVCTVCHAATDVKKSTSIWTTVKSKCFPVTLAPVTLAPVTFAPPAHEELRPESDSTLPLRSLEAPQGIMEQGME